MNSNIERFAKRVHAVMEADDKGLRDVNMMIETSYDEDIIPSGMTKGYFLGELKDINGEVFDATVEHLFTPVAWARLKMTQMWGIKYATTGNLLTLTHDREEDQFTLSEVNTDSTQGREREQMEDIPMLTDNKESAESFVTAIQRDYESREPSVAGVGEALMMLNLKDGLNPMNFEVVPVRLIF